MTLSDLLAALFVMLRIRRNKDIEVAWATWHVEGILGDTFFRLPHFTDEVSTTIPSQSIVLIAGLKIAAGERTMSGQK